MKNLANSNKSHGLVSKVSISQNKGSFKDVSVWQVCITALQLNVAKE